MQKPRPLSSHPAAYYNYLRLPAVYSAWSQTRNYPDPGSHCLGQSWDSTGPPLGPRPCPRSRTRTWGAARMRVDTTRVKAGSCPDRSRRCFRSTRCCPHNIYTQEARQDSPADTLEEEWMASALKWIIKDSCEEWYWNMVSMLIINERIDSGRGIIKECNFVWDYDCDWCCSRGWLGDKTQNSGHDLVHGERRERGRSYEEMAQNNAASDHWTHDTRLWCQSHSKHRDSVAKTFRASIAISNFPLGSADRDLSRFHFE